MTVMCSQEQNNQIEISAGQQQLSQLAPPQHTIDVIEHLLLSPVKRPKRTCYFSHCPSALMPQLELHDKEDPSALEKCHRKVTLVEEWWRDNFLSSVLISLLICLAHTDKHELFTIEENSKRWGVSQVWTKLFKKKRVNAPSTWSKSRFPQLTRILYLYLVSYTVVPGTSWSCTAKTTKLTLNIQCNRIGSQSQRPFSGSIPVKVMANTLPQMT